MSLFDALFGKTKPVKSKVEKLFAISTAYITMTARFGMALTGKAAICFRPVTSAFYQDLETELKDLLRISSRETETDVKLLRDDQGYQWVVFDDPDFEDLVSVIHMTSQTLQEKGFGEQLLAAVFKFSDDQRDVYWIYNYKRGFFYPFVPKGAGQDRQNAYELHLRNVMSQELPIEPELERWYPIWGMPI